MREWELYALWILSPLLVQAALIPLGLDEPRWVALGAFSVIDLGLAPTEANVLGTALTTLFNAHVHTGVTTGPGSSGPPATPMVPGVHTSVTVNTQ